MEHLSEAALVQTLDDLDRVLIDSDLWSSVIDQISRVMNARGGLLLSLDRQHRMPSSDAIADVIQRFWNEQWNGREFRLRAELPLKSGKVVTDPDIISYDEYRCDPFARGLLQPFDLPWWGSAGFSDGEDRYTISLLRSSAQGLFTESELEGFSLIAKRLSEVSTIARLSEHRAIGSMAQALADMTVGTAAVGIDGRVIRSNELFDALACDVVRVRAGKLEFEDQSCQTQYDDALAKLRNGLLAAADGREPIVVRRLGLPSILVRLFPISSPTGSIFGGARALVTFKVLKASRTVPAERIARVFGLTKTEARLVATLMTGITLKEAADELGMAVNTARVHLRSIFFKTSTDRQSELLRLVAVVD